MSRQSSTLSVYSLYKSSQIRWGGGGGGERPQLRTQHTAEWSSWSSRTGPLWRSRGRNREEGRPHCCCWSKQALWAPLINCTDTTQLPRCVHSPLWHLNMLWNTEKETLVHDMKVQGWKVPSSIFSGIAEATEPNFLPNSQLLLVYIIILLLYDAQNKCKRAPKLLTWRQ